MKKFIASLLIATQMCVVAPAFADPPTLPSIPDPVPGEVDVGTAISPMKKGRIAPFTGILLSPKATATIIAELNSFNDRIKLEVDHARAEEKALCEFRVAEQKTNCDADKKVLQAQIDARKKEVDALNEALKKERDSRPNTVLWTGLGFGAGLITTVLTVFAVSQAVK